MNFGFPITLAALMSLQPVCGQIIEVNPNIGHTHHHHHYGEKLPTEAASPQRFITSREGAAALMLPVEKDAFQFAVFGDRTGGPVDGVSVLADAVRDVNLLGPDMVLTVGDLIQGYNNGGSGDKWLAQANEYKDIMNRLSSPWFPVAGNHDTYWRGKENETRPVGENDSLFETHFGPLWYAFEHKNCWFIVLYSDETNPQTNTKDFTDPETQKMSPEQFNWLADTLKKAKDANHVFLFLHHPRWLGLQGKPNYGDDWNRVHELLKSAGNVSAVFAGHVHQMRSDGPRDGIEYITLATTGGHVPGYGESLGFLHHYDVVTVRKDGISLAAIPVGKVLDPREMTGNLITETKVFGEQELTPGPVVALAPDSSANASFQMEIANPTTRAVDFTLNADSEDSRWSFSPDHRHGTLQPGEKKKLEFHVTRIASPVDESFRDPRLTLEAEYLAPGFRYTIPKREIAVPVSFPNDGTGPPNRALRFDGVEDFLRVPSKSFDPGETITLECRFKGDRFDGRTGLVTKAQGSDYGLFVNNGKPTFSIFIGERYLSVSASQPMLDPDQWHHLAGQYDGHEARLYLDGKLVAAKSGEGTRKRNELPLVIGGDVDGAGTATSYFTGLIDYVRLSKIPRYQGEEISVPERMESDADTTLLLQMDEIIGLRLPDSSPSAAHAERCGKPALVPNR